MGEGSDEIRANRRRSGDAGALATAIGGDSIIVPIGSELDAGLFAIAVNLPSTDDASVGVRIAVETARLYRFPTLRAWFMHDRAFDEGSMTCGALIDELLGEGWRYLAPERVLIRVDPKKEWSADWCGSCGEAVPGTLLRGGVCAASGGQRYYEPLPVR
jgi:hypothetical protein